MKRWVWTRDMYASVDWHDPTHSWDTYIPDLCKYTRIPRKLGKGEKYEPKRPDIPLHQKLFVSSTRTIPFLNQQLFVASWQKCCLNFLRVQSVNKIIEFCSSHGCKYRFALWKPASSIACRLLWAIVQTIVLRGLVLFPCFHWHRMVATRKSNDRDLTSLATKMSLRRWLPFGIFQICPGQENRRPEGPNSLNAVKCKFGI